MMIEPWAPRIYAPNGFTEVDILGGAKALDFGCGGRKLPGALGMDILSLPSVDLVHDLNVRPWPLENGSFDLVFGNHALEHVDDVLGTLGEIHRVLKPGGRAVVQVPYFRSVDAVNDPTHKHFFATSSLDYCIQETELAHFRYTRFLFKKIGFWYGWPHRSRSLPKRMLKRFVASHSVFYDQYLSLLFPIDTLTWELEKTR